MNEKKLTLLDLTDLLANKAKISKKDSESFLKEFFAVIYDNILENDIVRIKDFGSFKPTLINSRESVDVNTGQKIKIPAHYRLTFTPDKSLKELINKPFASFESVVLDEGDTKSPNETQTTKQDNKIEKEIITDKKQEQKDKITDKPETPSYTSQVNSYIFDHHNKNDKKIEGTVLLVPDILSKPNNKESNPEEEKHPESFPVQNNLLKERQKIEVSSVLNTEQAASDTEDILDDDDLDRFINNIVERSKVKTSEVIPPPIPSSVDDINDKIEDFDYENYPFDDIAETEKIEIPKIQAIEPDEKYISDERIIVPENVASENFQSNIIEDDDTSIQVNHDHKTENIKQDIDKDNPDNQKDFAYPEDYTDIYEEESRTRDFLRIAPYLLVGIILIGIAIYAFIQLFSAIGDSKKVPYYGEEFISDSIPPKKELVNTEHLADLNIAVNTTKRNIDSLERVLNSNSAQTEPIKNLEVKQSQTSQNKQASQTNKKNEVLTDKPANKKKATEKEESESKESADNSPAEKKAVPPVKKETKSAQNEDSELQIMLNKAQEKRLAEKRKAFAAKNEEDITSVAPPKPEQSTNNKTIIIKRNDRLVDIASNYYGRKEFWVYIYQENKSKIPNPNSVSPGTVLVIPSLSKYEKNPNDPNAITRAKELEKKILNN